MNHSTIEAIDVASSNGGLSLSDQAARLVPRLVRLLRDTVGEGCALKQLTMTQVRAVSHLLHHPDVTLTALASALGIALGTASDIVERLVDLDLVERQTNPDDRRQVLLSLTADAAEMAREITRQRVEQIDEVIEGLTDEEAAGFLKGLDRWVDVLQHRVDTSVSTAASRKV